MFLNNFYILEFIQLVTFLQQVLVCLGMSDFNQINKYSRHWRRAGPGHKFVTGAFNLMTASYDIIHFMSNYL